MQYPFYQFWHLRIAIVYLSVEFYWSIHSSIITTLDVVIKPNKINEPYHTTSISIIVYPYSFYISFTNVYFSHYPSVSIIIHHYLSLSIQIGLPNNVLWIESEIEGPIWYIVYHHLPLVKGVSTPLR